VIHLAQVKELILDDFQESNLMKTEVEEKSKCKTMLSDIVENSRQLFITPILRFTIISIVINFTFHIGYYGLMMWFPELFNRFDEFHRDHPGMVTSICQVTDYVVNKGSHSVENVCSDKIGASVFMESLITVASAIPANIVAVLGMDRLGRKFFLGTYLNINAIIAIKYFTYIFYISLLIFPLILSFAVFSTFSSGLCSVGLYFVYNKYQNLIVSAIFSGAISCGNAALDCLITEVFPTQLRATGIAISMVAARLGGIIGNIVIAQLLDMYCPAPTFIVAALLIGKHKALN
jgi:VNT family MFS transporter (synaptic vesicle glycoprotein 2)